MLPAASAPMPSNPMSTTVDVSSGDAPRSCHGETTEDDMKDDSVDDDYDGDGDGTYIEHPKAAAAFGASSAMLLRTRNAVERLAQREQEEGEGHEDEGEDAERARMVAVIAAASLAEGTTWNGGVQGGGAGMRQLFEGTHQPQSQQHPKATEAVSWKAFTSCALLVHDIASLREVFSITS